MHLTWIMNAAMAQFSPLKLAHPPPCHCAHDLMFKSNVNWTQSSHVVGCSSVMFCINNTHTRTQIGRWLLTSAVTRPSEIVVVLCDPERSTWSLIYQIFTINTLNELLTWLKWYRISRCMWREKTCRPTSIAIKMEFMCHRHSCSLLCLFLFSNDWACKKV